MSTIIRHERLGRWAIQMLDQPPWMEGNQMNFYVRVVECDAWGVGHREHEVIGSIYRYKADEHFDALVQKYIVIMAGEVLDGTAR